MKRTLFSLPMLHANTVSFALFAQSGPLLSVDMLLNSKTFLESLKYCWKFQNNVRNSKILLESLRGCWNV